MDAVGFYFLTGVLATLGLTLLLRRKRRNKTKKRLWVCPWLRRRDLPGQQTILSLYKELLIDGDVDEFCATLRMDPVVYDSLLNLLRPSLTKKFTNFCRPISPEARLAVTMRYLALGEGFRSLSQQFRIGLSTVRQIVRHTCQAIYKTLQPKYMTTPSSAQEWYEVADAFYAHWNFPHCIGCIDGKHIRMMAPRNSGTFFYNYKDFFSIVLMAIVDSDYKFLYIDVGAEGKASDGGIWNQCSFYEHLHDHHNLLNIPGPSPIAGMPDPVPFMLVGDDAFRLSPNLMKPFPGRGLTHKERIFNYRLSRTRRVVENVFGILTCRFHIFRRTIEVNPNFVEEIVLACCVLHNFLREKSPNSYLPNVAIDTEQNDGNMIPGDWRQEVGLEPMRRSQQKNASLYAKKLRCQLADFFLTSDGELPWQYRDDIM